ncbi:alpha/beta hydrolase [Rhizobium laguerreae]|uniref:alpha/beta hydrolase n=1 Tax=Rhizobium laguerreae TaxID=1076926 RepID=UPI001C91BBFF|nr:alpha/beta fold hydrolase [Rhizobium laguerreae]MBY3151327.1 alpha/beta hydrolase [Rhizobium laguerreae]
MTVKACRTVRNFAVTFAILYAGCFAALWALQDRFIYPGVYESVPGWVGMASPVSVQRVTVPVDKYTDLAALYRRPGPGKPTIIVFHGNAGYPEEYGFLYKAWAASGYGIVAPVYRGYPRSSGVASADAILGDALAIYDWSARRHPASPVIVFGQSLGTAPAIHVAANRAVNGTILVSPFKSMLSIVSDRLPQFPVSLALRSPLRSDLDMPRVKSPVIIFHGDRDDVVPPASGKALAALAPSAPRFVVVKNAGHIDGLFGGVMVVAINRFIAEIVEMDVLN